MWGFRTENVDLSPRSNQHVLVRGITVEELMREHGLESIDLLKVDIEGAEKEIFEKCSPWIDRVRAIAVEVHERFKEGCAESVSTARKDFGKDVSVGRPLSFRGKNSRAMHHVTRVRWRINLFPINHDQDYPYGLGLRKVN